MENNTYIKLYRKALDNGMMRDHLAWVVFTWLLLNVDRTKGKKTFGRFQMADELGIKPNTLYVIIKRLETKWGVIKVNRQTKYTEVWIVNWAKYQYTESAPSNEHQMSINGSSNEYNTIQEVKNKEIRRESGEIVLTKNQLHALEEEFPKVDVPRSYERFKLWQQANGKTFTNTLARFKMWLQDEKKNVKVVPKKIPEFKPNLPKPEELVSDERIAEFIKRKKEILHT